MKILTGLLIVAMAMFMTAGTPLQLAGDAEARSYKRHGHYHGYRRYNRWRRGVAIGVGTAVVIGAGRYGYSCRNLAYRCRHGEGWACARFDDRC